MRLKQEKMTILRERLEEEQKNKDLDRKERNSQLKLINALINKINLSSVKERTMQKRMSTEILAATRFASRNDRRWRSFVYAKSFL